MNNVQKQLEKVVDSYYTELMNIDVSDVRKHKYSKRYITRIKDAYAVFDTERQPKPHKIRRRIFIAIIVAALIGTITAVAYEPVRKFFLNVFSDHTEVIPGNNSTPTDNHKSVIEKKYSIIVPEGYVLDEESSIVTDEFVIQTFYYASDRSRSLIFEQKIKSDFGVNVDNKQADITTKYDKYGNELLVYNMDDKSVLLIWDNGEYIFDLSGEMTESELMEIYYTIIK